MDYFYLLNKNPFKRTKFHLKYNLSYYTMKSPGEWSRVTVLLAVWLILPDCSIFYKTDPTPKVDLFYRHTTIWRCFLLTLESESSIDSWHKPKNSGCTENVWENLADTTVVKQYQKRKCINPHIGLGYCWFVPVWVKNWNYKYVIIWKIMGAGGLLATQQCQVQRHCEAKTCKEQIFLGIRGCIPNRRGLLSLYIYYIFSTP